MKADRNCKERKREELTPNEELMANLRTVWCPMCGNPYDTQLSIDICETTCPECGQNPCDDPKLREVIIGTL